MTTESENYTKATEKMYDEKMTWLYKENLLTKILDNIGKKSVEVGMLFLNVNGQLCDNITSVDLSDSAKFLDGSIVKNGIRFPPEYIFNSNTSGVLCIILTLLSCVLCKKCNTSIDISEGVRDTDGGIFFEDRHYEENEHYFDNETNTEMGCICLKTACIFKCCPFGMKYDSIQRQCVTDTDEFNPIVFDAYKRILNEKAKDIFHFNFGRAKCENDEVSIRIGELTAVHNLRLDGKLYIELPTSIPPWVVRGPDKYCIDTFVVEDDKGNVKTSLDALVCFADEPDNDRYMYVDIMRLHHCHSGGLLLAARTPQSSRQSSDSVLALPSRWLRLHVFNADSPQYG
ncbi:unnamed protein product [Leptidea sinapis]|uniref:Methuselah N-terminal domain-containing protein n=1 Tax=Leptidea sinapis TaxID=189913 RepID=A0A5E4Q2E7_9NEOP|nr:unnamed protein product [Leptidea sinapis]